MDGKQGSLFYLLDPILMLFRISQTFIGDKEGSFARYS